MSGTVSPRTDPEGKPVVTAHGRSVPKGKPRGRTSRVPGGPAAPRQVGLYLDGRSREAANGQRFPAVEPATGRVLAGVAEAGEADIDLAVFIARRALESGPWPMLGMAQRARLLHAFADLLETHAGDLARLIAQDQGRVISETLRTHLPRATRLLREAATVGRDAGETQPASGHDTQWRLTRSRPCGVVAQIISWQSPLLDLCRAWASAWAAGCACIVKPAPEASLVAVRLAELAGEAGLAPGVVNVLPGPAEVGRALIRHAGVDAVWFTGRPATLRQVLIDAADGFKPVSAEVGGLCPLVVFDDADLDAAASQIADAAFASQGQFRAAPSRVLVARSVSTELLARLGELAHDRTAGDPTRSGTKLGPMIDAAHADNARWMLQRCLGHGGRLVGPALSEIVNAEGFLRPAVVETCDANCPVARRPIPGPMLAVTTFDHAGAALETITAAGPCPAVGVWTADLPRAQRFADAVLAGRVFVNHFDVLGADALETDHTRTQHVSIAASPPSRN